MQLRPEQSPCSPGPSPFRCPPGGTVACPPNQAHSPKLHRRTPGRREPSRAARGWGPHLSRGAGGRGGPARAHTHTHRHAQTHSGARAPHWREEEGGASKPKTNNLRQRLCRRAAVWPPPGARPVGSWGAAATSATSFPHPLQSATRPRPRGAAAGLYWAGPKVEARRSRGRPAGRCCPRGWGREGGCGRSGLGDSPPRVLKAEGAGPSPTVARTSSGTISVPRRRPHGTWDLLGSSTSSRCARCFSPAGKPSKPGAPGHPRVEPRPLHTLTPKSQP